MHVGDRTERGLACGRAIKLPRNLLADWVRVIEREFGKHVVRMLVIDQRLTMISFAGLEELRKSRMRRSQRLGRKHFTKQDAATLQFSLCCSINISQFTDSALPSPRGPPCWL